jgi:hypothetical protein
MMQVVRVEQRKPIRGVEADAMITDRRRDHVQMRKLDEYETTLMGKDTYAWFTAWWSRPTGWVLLDRAPEQYW